MVTLGVFVCMNTLERVLLCVFVPCIMVFFIIDTQLVILSYQILQLPCMHEEPEHITYFLTYRSAWTILYVETVFLSVIR